MRLNTKNAETVVGATDTRAGLEVEALPNRRESLRLIALAVRCALGETPTGPLKKHFYVIGRVKDDQLSFLVEQEQLTVRGKRRSIRAHCEVDDGFDPHHHSLLGSGADLAHANLAEVTEALKLLGASVGAPKQRPADHDEYECRVWLTVDGRKRAAAFASEEKLPVGMTRVDSNFKVVSPAKTASVVQVLSGNEEVVAETSVVEKSDSPLDSDSAQLLETGAAIEQYLRTRYPNQFERLSLKLWENGWRLTIYGQQRELNEPSMTLDTEYQHLRGKLPSNVALWMNIYMPARGRRVSVEQGGGFLSQRIDPLHLYLATADYRIAEAGIFRDENQRPYFGIRLNQDHNFDPFEFLEVADRIPLEVNQHFRIFLQSDSNVGRTAEEVRQFFPQAHAARLALAAAAAPD